MKKQSQYDKLFTEKMRDLPVPDADSSWQLMKQLLDKELPEDIVVTPPPVAVRNYRILWIAAALLALIVTFVTIEYLNRQTKVTPIPEAFITQTITNSNSSDTPGSTRRQNGSFVAPGSTSAKAITQAQQQVANVERSALSSSTTTLSRLKRDTQKEKASNYHSISKKPYKKTIASLSVSAQPLENTFTTAAPDDEENNDKETPATTDQTSKFNQTGSSVQFSVPVASAAANHTDSVLTNTTTLFANNNSTAISLTNQHHPRQYYHYLQVAVPDENFYYSKQQAWDSIAEGFTTSQKITVPVTVWQLPDVTKKQKAILKERKRAERKNERELAKSYRSNASFWGSGSDRWFAAGLAPFQDLAIGTQQSYGYNSGGSRGIATDYIPAPYLQFHVTDKIYLLSEFQFNAPQATPNMLVSQKINTAPINNWSTENTFLRKLYYFNMPLSFYYSPVKNVYIGSGIQFSSFNSGLAYREQRSANNSILYSEVVKLKDDSLSQAIRSSEWRYLFDANYYINRFMFGVRYNQALTDYVNFVSSPGATAIQARNQSLQLYIRYNIIVSKKGQ